MMSADTSLEHCYACDIDYHYAYGFPRCRKKEEERERSEKKISDILSSLELASRKHKPSNIEKFIAINEFYFLFLNENARLSNTSFSLALERCLKVFELYQKSRRNKLGDEISDFLNSLK